MEYSMSYMPIQQLFDLQTGIKTVVEQAKQIVPMWDDTNGKAFYKVSYWDTTTNAMVVVDVSADMSSTYAAGASVFPLEATLRSILTLLSSGSLVTVLSGTSAVNVTNFPVTQPVSVSSLPLPMGSSTATLQSDANNSLSSIDAKTPVFGQALMSASMPVVLSSNHTTIPTSLASNTDGSQKTQIIDAAGNSVDTIQAGGDCMMVAQSATGFITSVLNSTTAQLAGSATFAGAIETIFNQQTISVLLTSDKSGTLTLRQYIDVAGTRVTNTWAISIVANVPFSKSFTGNGNFFNLTFANSAGAATTTLNINTAYGTLFPATNLGNVPVSLDEINGTTLSLGRKVEALSIPFVQAKNNMYFAAVNNLVVANLASDIFTIYGSASRTIVIKSLKVSATQTVSGSVVIRTVKKNAVNTGGTSSSPTAIPANSVFAASTAILRTYTANPVIAGLLGAINVSQLLVPSPAALVFTGQLEMVQDDIVLNGVNEGFALNLFGTQTMAGNNFQISISWEEF